MKQCISEGCENGCVKGRRYCREHYLERQRELAKARHKQKGRYCYTTQCLVCGKTIKGWRKSQKFCMECYKQVQKTGANKPNSYANGKGKGYAWQHRRIAEEVLNHKLNSNEVVHHLNGKPQDNALTNLIVMSRAKHGALHSYLRTQRALLAKANEGNFENCWNSLIVPMTTTWLETAGVKVTKLWEIGQSAAEPLVIEEGSETMHEAAKHSSAS